MEERARERRSSKFEVRMQNEERRPVLNSSFEPRTSNFMHFSVVIPTYNRLDMLVRVLDAPWMGGERVKEEVRSSKFEARMQNEERRPVLNSSFEPRTS